MKYWWDTMEDWRTYPPVSSNVASWESLYQLRFLAGKSIYNHIYILSHHIISNHIILYYITLHYIILYYIIFCYVMLLYHKLNIGIYIYIVIMNIYIYICIMVTYICIHGKFSIAMVDSRRRNRFASVDTHDPRRGPIRWWHGPHLGTPGSTVHRFTGSARVGKELPGLRRWWGWNGMLMEYEGDISGI